MSDHCKIFAKSLALKAECLAASNNYDAARAWSLLGSRAQNILKALCAAGEAPAVSAGSSEPAASRARTASGLARFPEDVLGAIIAFVDLPMRFTCVAACSTLRDACARQSPRLEHSLLAKRFPLLATIGLTGAPAPRELFRTFEDFSRREFLRAPPFRRPTASLGAYTLWLELELCKKERGSDPRGWRAWRRMESIQVGAGALTNAEEGLYRFTVPDAGLHERFNHRILNQAGGFRSTPESDERWNIRARVVATRRNASGQLQFAEVYCSFLTDHHGFAGGVTCMQFFSGRFPVDRKNIALEFIKRKFGDRDEFMDPGLHMDWHSGSPSTIHAQWKWSVIDTFEDMDGPDASMMLEHLADWK